MADIEGDYQESNGHKRDKNGVLRDEKGRIVKGSGPLNPVGHPKTVAHIRELAQEWTEEAIEKLGWHMRNAEKDRDQIEAARELLNRGWGKPSTSVEIQHENGDSQSKLIELSKLSKDQLEQLETMIDIAREQQGDDEDAT